MGCASSVPSPTPKAPSAKATLLDQPPAAKVQGRGKGKGKGKSRSQSKGEGKGKGKGKGKSKKSTASKFQIELEGKWENYCAEEDAILKRAYLVGHPNARYHLRGHDYEYSFQNMKQKNLGTGKQRNIRPPYGMKPPAAPLLPPGAMVVITVPEGYAGKVYTIDDPRNPGQTIEVAVPAGAKAGAKMAVPVPQKGETAADVRKRQQGFSTGAKVALVGAAAGAGVVGGVILGDHLTGGAVTDAMADSAAAEWVEGAAADAGEWAEGAYTDAAAWTEGAAADAGEWAEGAYADAAAWTEGAAADAGEWAEGAYADAAAWTEGAATDAGEWFSGAADDVSDWMGAAEDAGDFIMDLF